ncbi:MAG: thioredoxin [Clostridiales bacterium]|nr:thioredoxin [Clostridiales bacterium]
MELILNNDNFEELVLKADKPVLVDFWATWCMPCRMLAPVVEELAEELEGQVIVGKLDVDEAPQLAVKYRVASIPTLIVFENGREDRRTVGVQDKEDLKEFALQK